MYLNTQSIPSLAHRHLSCFRFFTTKLPWIFLKKPLCTCARVSLGAELQDHTTCASFPFLTIIELHFQEAVLMYIPIRSIWEFLFLHTFHNTCYCRCTFEKKYYHCLYSRNAWNTTKYILLNKLKMHNCFLIENIVHYHWCHKRISNAYKPSH